MSKEGGFWQRRYYDFNVWADKKRAEKPEDWSCASFRYCAFGEVGTLEIESEWTARRWELNCMSGEVTGDNLSFD